MFDAGHKGRGLRATKELRRGDVVFAEASFSAVVFDRCVCVRTTPGGGAGYLQSDISIEEQTRGTREGQDRKVQCPCLGLRADWCSTT